MLIKKKLRTFLFVRRNLIYNGKNNMQAWGLIVLLVSKAAGHSPEIPDMEQDKAAGVLHRFVDRNNNRSYVLSTDYSGRRVSLEGRLLSNSFFSQYCCYGYFTHLDGSSATEYDKNSLLCCRSITKPWWRSPCGIIAFKISMVTVLGFYSCFPSGRFDSLWFKSIHIKEYFFWLQF